MESVTWTWWCSCFTLVPLLLVQVGLLNVGGYYDSLLTLFDNMHAQGFLKFNARTLVVSAPTPAELLDKLEVSVDQDLSHPSRCILGDSQVLCNLYETFRSGNFVFLTAGSINWWIFGNKRSNNIAWKELGHWEGSIHTIHAYTEQALHFVFKTTWKQWLFQSN